MNRRRSSAKLLTRDEARRIARGEAAGVVTEALAPSATSADVFESSLGRAGYSIDGFALQNARKVLN
jgi:hypothetical protein